MDAMYNPQLRPMMITRRCFFGDHVDNKTADHVDNNFILGCVYLTLVPHEGYTYVLDKLIPLSLLTAG